MYIYIISHPKFEGWIKLGKAINFKQRLTTYQTHVPDRAFKCEFLIKTNFANNIENHFINQVEGNGFEWYKCNIDFAVNKIQEQLKILENQKIDSKKENYRNINIYPYDYLTDGQIFRTIEDLANYIGCKSYKIELAINQDKKRPGLFFNFNDYEIIRRKHIK